MTLPKSLAEFAEKEAENILEYHGCNSGDCPHDQQSQCFITFIQEGATAMYEKLLSMGAEFDVNECYEPCDQLPNDSVSFLDAFIDGAKWQNQQSVALIAARDAKIANLKSIRADLIDACEELVEVMNDPDYEPDSFTIQTLERALNKFKESESK